MQSVKPWLTILMNNYRVRATSKRSILQMLKVHILIHCGLIATVKMVLTLCTMVRGHIEQQ